MTAREKKLFIMLIRYMKAFDDANPDVGLPPSTRSFITEVADTLDMTLTEQEYCEIEDTVLYPAEY